MLSIYTISFLVGLIILFIALFSFKKRKLDFSYCLFWVVMTIALMILCFNVEIFEKAAIMLKVQYAPALLFASGMLFILAFIFYITIFITKVKGEVTKLTQEIGILKKEMEDLKKTIDKK